MWKKQFEALRDGDRFFYLNDPVLDSIRQKYGIDYRKSLAQVIDLNTKADVRGNPFFAPRADQSEERRGPTTGASLFDGASRARTGDLLHAMQALSQLSYGPGLAQCSVELVLDGPVILAFRSFLDAASLRRNLLAAGKVFTGEESKIRSYRSGRDRLETSMPSFIAAWTIAVSAIDSF